MARALLLLAAGLIPCWLAIHFRLWRESYSTMAEMVFQPTGERQPFPGPIVFLSVHEACAHISFFLTGHRGRVTTGSLLKAFLDTKDVMTHALLGICSPFLLLALAHAAMLAWHTGKAADSVLISGYSPMRGLYWPNLIDAAIYSLSAAVGAFESTSWALAGFAVYGCLRLADRVY